MSTISTTERVFPPVKPPSKFELHITDMSREEFRDLVALFARVAGHETQSTRALTEKLVDAMVQQLGYPNYSQFRFAPGNEGLAEGTITFKRERSTPQS